MLFDCHLHTECPVGTYGANCALKCECESGGSCNRFSGCVCANGYHGQHCEKSDHHPQIVNLPSQVEFNLDSPAVLTCAASGNPQPVLGSIVLRRPDGSVIMASNALLDAERSTCTFTVPAMTLNDHGLWECRVSTSGGQDNLKFRVLVKVPPTPLEPPRLLGRGSRALILEPIYNFSGDGPISSIKLLYQLNGMKSDWSSIIVEQKDSITLPNLKPVTAYQVRYQLSRPGPGGEGPLGPIAVLETDCIGPSPPKDVHVNPLSRDSMKVIWSPPDDPNGGIIKYTVESRRFGVLEGQQWTDTEGHNQTWKIIKDLNSSTSYQIRVRASSRVPGEWSQTVIASTFKSHPMVPSMESRNPRVPNSGQQLLLAIIGSVSVTCFTIIVALLALFCIKKNLFRRRKMFTYQSGSGEETILQFSSGTLTLTRRPRPQTEPFTYPILAWADIKFEDVIGEGNFGQVIKAMIKKDGVRMNAAVKMLKEFASENDHRDFAGELEVLCKLGHHPNIINLLGACENRGYLYIAIEFAPFGNLLDFLRKSRVLETDPAFAKEHGTASTLTSQQLLQFASDVAKGMQYLSEKQFIHRDLAARNILVGENLVGKIADFGLSRGEEVYVKKTMGRLPVRWMAIESLNYSVYTTKSDV
ncbi:hypothetical protein AB205_0178920 [Aquarana catesbeiana]|uniref:receptor protein-tyrosine kinase n=1 Tax=Aquarana catesbeiana TaxID=8400 RepID=A0A2G9RNI0_AQUCT|nr:hypothetical protein AB205_0178920 [Aquarana catesbeiana]